MRVSPNLETGCKKFVHNKEKLKKILSKTVTTLQAVHKQYTAEADSSTLYGGATAGRSPAALPLKWQNDKLLCTEQWPRTKKKKLRSLEQLIQEQPEPQHIEESIIPWNSPVFVIKKKSGGRGKMAAPGGLSF